MATSSEVVIEQVARIVGTAVVVCSYFLVVFPLRVLPLAWALLSCYFVWWSYLSVFVCRFVPVFCEVVFVVHCRDLVILVDCRGFCGSTMRVKSHFNA